MAIFPRKPQAGDKVLQSIYNAVCQIIDFLPSLEIRGDNKTIKIDSFSSGKTISAVRQSHGINHSQKTNIHTRFFCVEGNTEGKFKVVCNDYELCFQIKWKICANR